MVNNIFQHASNLNYLQNIENYEQVVLAPLLSLRLKLLIYSHKILYTIVADFLFFNFNNNHIKVYYK